MTGHPRVYRREVLAFNGRYITAGALNTLAGFGCIAACTALGMNPFAANVLGYGVGLIIGYLMARGFVFRSTSPWAGEMLGYILCFVLSYVLNLLVLYGGLNVLKTSAIASQFAALVVYVFSMYALSRWVVFRRTDQPVGK